MSVRGHRLPRLAVAAALLLLGGVAVAEVATQNGNNTTVDQTLLMDRITDDADPIPQLRWNVYRPVPNEQLLNPSGALRLDGRPDIVWHPATQFPYVVWAYNNQTDHDIAFSSWVGDGWAPTEFLTSGIEDELDPRVWVNPDGMVVVVWWVDGPDPNVMISALPTGSDAWIDPVQVDPPGEHARRPTVILADGVYWVAYERQPSTLDNTVQELVVRRYVDLAVGFVQEHSITVNRTGVLEPVLQTNGQTTWLSWMNSANQFGYSYLDQDGGWSAPEVEPWNDSTWVGVESMRRIVRTRVMHRALSSQEPPPGEF